MKIMSKKGFVLMMSLSVFSLMGCSIKTQELEKGMALIQNFEYGEAIEQFQIAQENGEHRKLLERGRGIALMGATSYEEAVTSFQNALASSNGVLEEVDFDINYYLAATYTKLEKYEEALKIYDAIISLKSEEEEAHFLRGNVLLYIDKGNYTKAKESFDKAIEINPKNFDRIIQIYELMQQFGYKEVGEDYINQAMSLYESEMSAYNRGRMYYFLGEYAKAYIALEEAKDLDGATAYLYLGLSYEATGDYNYASTVYNNYLDKYGADEKIYNQLGLCELSKKEYEKALNAFQNGLQMETNGIMQTLLFNEIVAYEFLGEYEQAKALIENYLAKYPDDQVAKREFDFLSTR